MSAASVANHTGSTGDVSSEKNRHASVGSELWTGMWPLFTLALRRDRVLSLPVGRFAPFAAAIVLVLAFDVALSMVVAGSLLAGGAPAAGAWTMGIAVGVTGLLFAAVALITSQVSSSARGATGIALAVLGVTFLIRAAGDVMKPSEGSWLSWVSPLAWGQQSRAFVAKRWWPLALSAVVTVELFVFGWALGRGRDVGAGLIAERAGRVHASRTVLSPGGLAFKLSRATYIGWLVGLAVTGLLFGSLAYAVDDMLDQSPELATWIGAEGAKALLDTFAGMMLTFMVVGAACLGVGSGRRLPRRYAGHARLGAESVPRLSLAAGTSGRGERRPSGLAVSRRSGSRSGSHGGHQSPRLLRIVSAACTSKHRMSAGCHGSIASEKPGNRRSVHTTLVGTSW